MTATHASPDATPDAGTTTDTRPLARRRLITGVVLAAIAAVVILLMLQCDLRPAPPFDYFRARAGELGNDAARATAWVKDDVATLPYRGRVKGALGALWDEAGSPDEKLLLLRALLVYCEGAPAVTLDTVAPDRDTAGDPGGTTTYTLTVVLRAWPAGADEPAETDVWTGPVESLIGSVHSVEVTGPDATTVTINGDDGTTGTVRHADLVAEDLVFRIERPGGETREVVRELWREGNRVGLDARREGDRHDFVALPCRISEYVKEQELAMVQRAGTHETPAGNAYRMLLEYAQQADELLARTEAQHGVRAIFDEPRILIISQVEHDRQQGIALDLRHNLVRFTGGEQTAWRAANDRSWNEAALEGTFLQESAGVPTTSAWKLFQRLNQSRPDSPARRLELLSEALGGLMADRGRRTREVTLAGGSAPDAPTVRASFVDGALRLQGGPIHAELAARLREGVDDVTIPYAEDGTLDTAFPRTREGLAAATIAVETTLLGAGAGEHYVLATTIVREPRLVVENARFDFGDESTGQQSHGIHVTRLDSGLQFAYRVRDGLHIVKGERQLTGETLDAATTHNPWYGRGEVDLPDGVTSFCVSRQVRRDLLAGQPAPFTLMARRDPAAPPDATRTVAWEGDLTLAGRGTTELTINGRVETLPVLDVQMGDRIVHIIDHPLYPIGLANRLTSVTTAATVRIVDEDGVGHAGVKVSRVPGGEELVTDVDGTVVLPPGTEGLPWGVVALKVVREAPGADGPVQTDLGTVEADLTGVGLTVLPVTVARRPVEATLIMPDEVERLDALPVSDQVKRHARRSLTAGKTIAIPTAMVDTGLLDAVAYFEHDPATGNLIGVSEDGLHGASANWDGIRNRIAGELMNRLAEANTDLKNGIHPIHMIRGFIVAYGVYASYMLKSGGGHDQVIERMLEEMEMWEQRTNLFTHMPDAVGNTQAGALVNEIGNTNGAVSFYIGYLSALMGLHDNIGRG